LQLRKILEGFKKIRERIDKPWGKDLIWLEKFIRHLISNRDLSGIYPISSHCQLIFVIANSLSDRRGKPIINIQITYDRFLYEKDKFRYEFKLIQRKKDEDIYRENVESVCCSFEKSLEVFDEMFEKLKVLTENNSQINSLK
jgi:hypothetical protein